MESLAFLVCAWSLAVLLAVVAAAAVGVLVGGLVRHIQDYILEALRVRDSVRQQTAYWQNQAHEARAELTELRRRRR